MRHDPDRHHRAVTPAQLEVLGKMAGPAKAVAAAEMLSAAPLVSALVIRGLVKASEAILIAALGIVAWYGVGPSLSVETAAIYVPLISVVAIILPFALGALGTHSIHALSRPVGEVTRIAAAWSVMFAVVIATIFALKVGTSFSRAWAGTWFFTGLIGLLLLRIAVAVLIRRWNQNGQLSRRSSMRSIAPPTPMSRLSAFSTIATASVRPISSRDIRGLEPSASSSTSCAARVSICWSSPFR
jgi:hypothetical protein